MPPSEPPPTGSRDPQGPSPSTRPEGAEGWKETLRKAVNLAAEDPEAFRNAAEMAALKLGMTVDQLVVKLKQDPDFLKRNARRAIGNATIQGIAKRLKREFGL